MFYLKQSAIALLLIGVLYIVFHRLGQFSNIQSILLALFATVALDAAVIAFDASVVARKSAFNSNSAFEPYWVRIEPIWFRILKDHAGLTVGEWEKLLEKPRPTEYSAFYSGVTFTVLSRNLYFSNDRKDFFGALDLKFVLEELKEEENPDSPFASAPYLYVKKAIGDKDIVIELGIATSKSREASRYPSDKRSNIVLACLPESIFYDYLDREAPISIEMRDKAAKHLMELGWTEEKKDDSPDIDWPIEMKHQYFRVSYHGV